MNDGSGPSDAAWVAVDTPLPPADLAEMAGDVERLLRINPMLEFEVLAPEGPDRLRMVARNLSTGKSIDTLITLKWEGDVRVLAYDAGLKARTLVRVEPGPQGSRLLITDDYDGLPEAERLARADEVDRSLVPWGHALFEYFRLWRRWRWLRPWRWYMETVWLPMRPSARRIAYMLWAITAFEVVLLVLAVVVLRPLNA